MAYRKTEKVVADIEGRKTALTNAALDIVAKHGIVGFSTELVAARAKVSVGLVYRHFADKTELLAATTAQVLQTHVAFLRADTLSTGLRAWLKLLTQNYQLMVMIGTIPAYREGIKAELAKQLRAAGADSPALTAAVIYGACLEAAGTLSPRNEGAFLALLMRACGLRVTA